MTRTAFSPIFNEGLDFSCVLFDKRRQHDRAGRVLPGAAGGEPVHRPLDGRGARRGLLRARRRRPAQRPLPGRRAHPRALGDPAGLPRRRALGVRRERRPSRRDRRQGGRLVRRGRHRGLPGGTADPAREDRRARREQHGSVAADHGQPPHAAEHVGRPQRADRFPAGRRAPRRRAARPLRRGVRHAGRRGAHGLLGALDALGDLRDPGRELRVHRLDGGRRRRRRARAVPRHGHDRRRPHDRRLDGLRAAGRAARSTRRTA